MKKIILKIIFIILILQFIMFVNNINPVFASSIFDNMDSAATTFKDIGENHISVMGLASESFSGLLGDFLSFIQIIAIAFAAARLLWTATKLLWTSSVDKAEAKRSLTINFIILGIAVVGPKLAITLINLFQ